VDPGREGLYIGTVDWEPLVRAAATARTHAYAPYSRFAVGAAVLMEDGSIHAAGNCENSIPALSICAERGAVARATSAGLRRPLALAVVTTCSPPARPCGLCRQTLAEFADDLPILVANPEGERQELRLSELFPQPFRMGALAGSDTPEPADRGPAG
jgi:cytidine deaminase